MPAMAALGANAADLVVWWEKGFNPEAVRGIIAGSSRRPASKSRLLEPLQDDIMPKRPRPSFRLERRPTPCSAR
jgi:hypothetical protein